MMERLYRMLLFFSPRAFRERFGDELLATARDVDRGQFPLHYKLRAVVDAVTTTAALHADVRTESRNVPTNGRATSMDSLGRDLRFAARGLWREPLFAAFVVITLALGIGANAAMFGIADRLLLRGPEHIANADRVVRLFRTERPVGQSDFTTSVFGEVEFDILRKGTTAFDGIAQYTINDGVAGRGTEARTVKLGYASPQLFPLLGVRPALGRFIEPDDDVPNDAQHVIVLSYTMWQADFGGARDVIGKNVTINDETFLVIGVAPRGFTGPSLGRVDYWAPVNLLGPRVTKDWQTAWNAQWIRGVARLKPGVTRERAALELTAAHRRGYSGTEKEIATANLFVADLAANNQGVESTDFTVLRWLSGVAVLVLLIACANVANLLIARGVRRSREMAIRSALGASRMRIMRLLLLESLMLSLCGAALGLVIAYVLGSLARASVFTYVDWPGAPVNLRVMVASGLIALVTGLAIGLIPAWRVSRPDLGGALKSGLRDGGGRRSRIRAGLTVVQAAFSVALLIGAGLFVRSLWEVRSLNLGIDAEHVLTLSTNRTSLGRMPPGPERDAENKRRRGFALLALHDVKRVPGVNSAAVAVGMPFGNRFGVPIRIPGLDSVPKISTGSPSVSAVTGDYFATAGTRIIRGRAFTEADREGSERVAIVNATMAETVWPNADAIGKCLIAFADTLPCAHVIGVSENTRRNQLREEPTMHFYVPYGQEVGIGGSVILVNSSGDPRTLLPGLQSALTKMDATILNVNGTTIQEQLDPQTRPWRLGAAVFAMSGILALIVAAFGIYSVMSYLIADRHHEIGVRIALGARGTDITALVLKGSLLMAAIGVAIGEMLALSLSHFVQPMLFETSAKDATVFATVGALLLMVAVVATLAPAFRARRVNPLEALRTE